MTAEGLTGRLYHAILYGIQHNTRQRRKEFMPRKNIIPKTVYIPEESQDIWAQVRKHIDLDSDSAVIWNLIQNKFHEIRDGKGKRQVMQDVLDGLSGVANDTASLLEEIASIKMAIGLLQEALVRVEKKLENHGF